MCVILKWSIDQVKRDHEDTKDEPRRHEGPKEAGREANLQCYDLI
jgi:hypothetical protein